MAESDFISACSAGRVEDVKRLLCYSDLDVHAKREAAFRCACAYGRLEVVQLLLELKNDRSIDVHIRNEHAFALACAGGHAQVVELLLSLNGHQYVDVHAYTELDEHTDRSNYLDIERLYEAMKRGFVDDYVFFLACVNGNAEVVQMLLDLKDARFINVNTYKDWAFALACEKGHVGVVRLLLELKGARAINLYVEASEAFVRACANGHVEVAQLLAFHCARYIHAACFEEAFSCARKNHKSRVMQLLLGLTDLRRMPKGIVTRYWRRLAAAQVFCFSRMCHFYY